MLFQNPAILDHEAAWTNLAQTARLLGIDRSTLSKQAQAGQVRCLKLGLGRGQLVVPPAEVLRLADRYRRVPMKEVQKKLAHEMAAQLPSAEGTLLRALERLRWSDTAELDPIERKGAEMITRVLLVKGERRDEEATTVVGRDTVPFVIDFGRLRPRHVPPTEVPSADLLQAIDLRRPRQPDLQIADSNPSTINFGRLRPGKRL